MNKLTKIGASALCGSLAAISAANAGDMSVTGGVDMSWISKPKDVVGNPIGIGSNLTFSGSGELDNGWTVALSVADTNKAVYSNTNVTVTIPGFGDIRIDQGVSGTGIDRMDDMTPNVWEEAYGTGLSGKSEYSVRSFWWS
jgi:outer membrane protein OmpU